MARARKRLPSRRDLLAGGVALVAARATGACAQTQDARPAAPAPATPPPAPVPPPPAPPIDVDIHCHTFCAADLPIVGFVAHYIPGLTDLSRELTRWPELVVRAIVKTVARLPNAAAPAGAAELESLRAALKAPAPIAAIPTLPPSLVEDLLGELLRLVPFSVSPETRRMLARYVDTVYLVSHARASLAATLADAYPTVALFTPSLVDYDAWSDDRAPTPLATQIQIQSLIARLSIQGKIGRPDARVHPFVAYDPRREVEAKGSALEMVRQAIDAAGFLGVKVYPPVGFAPTGNARWRPRQALSPKLDAALRALYLHCDAEEVPITAHASAENEYGIGLRELVAPGNWAPVLESHPGLRLNFGHFGHDYGVDPQGGVRAPKAWIRQAAALMQAFPNVYADLSNSPLVYDPAYAARFTGYLREVVADFPKIKRRLMYGSDWWLDRLEPGSADAVQATRQQLGSFLSTDEVADVMGRNALRFLGFLDDDNRPRRGRAARRLRRFYGQSPVPAWLP